MICTANISSWSALTKSFLKMISAFLTWLLQVFPTLNYTYSFLNVIIFFNFILKSKIHMGIFFSLVYVKLRI